MTASGTIIGLRVVAIPVTDQDRALAFYTEVLGLRTTRDGVIDEMGSRWVELSPSGSDVGVALVAQYEGFDAPRDTGIRLRTDDAEAVHRRLREAGATVGELLRWEGIPPMFEITDPDGNTAYVME